MTFCWPSCSLLFCLQLFSLSLRFLYRLVVWGWGLRTDRVSISLSRPCMPIFFNNNKNNNQLIKGKSSAVLRGTNPVVPNIFRSATRDIWFIYSSCGPRFQTQDIFIIYIYIYIHIYTHTNYKHARTYSAYIRIELLHTANVKYLLI